VVKPVVLLLAWAALAASCASNVPPPRLYQLRSAPPAAVVALPTTQVVQLLLPVALPELLERDALLLPQGQAGVQALAGHRWAEPLRDAVPRLLRQDLTLWLGPRGVWTAPLPPGLVVTRQLRVDVLQLLANSERNAVMLQARWTLSDPSGGSPPRVEVTSLSAPSAGADPDALVAAHRLVLWKLAEQIAAALR
jgi:uncharacterized protein